MRRILAVLLILLVWLPGLVSAASGMPDKDGMLADLELLLQWGDRASGSPREVSAAKLIEARFKELGLQVEIQDFVERGIQSQNIIGTKPGSDPHAGVITVTAHYDSATPGVPGANDNASGTVVMLELARLWADRATSSTIQFIAFGAEERGLLGARYYITSPQAEGVVLNLNLDMVGKGGKISLDRAPAWLIRAIAQSAQKHGYPFELHYATMAALRSDGSPTDGQLFSDKGIPTVTFSCAEGLEDGNYHSPADNLANINGEDLGRVAVVVNDLLERYDGQKVPWGDRNFIALTVLGRLVIIPGWVTYLVVVAALIVWMGLIWSCQVRGVSFRTGLRSLVWRALSWLAAVLAAETTALIYRRVVEGYAPGAHRLVSYPWHYLLALPPAALAFWLLDRRHQHDNDQRHTDLLALALPVALMLVGIAFGAWDYALMLALAVLPAAVTVVARSRWSRLALWLAALIVFLYLSASNWLPRAGTIRAILEFVYIPALGVMGARTLECWTKRTA